jgi:hypothetical protein
LFVQLSLLFQLDPYDSVLAQLTVSADEDVTVVASALKTLSHMLHAPLHQRDVFQVVGKKLADKVEVLANHASWEVRDSCMEFLASLFENKVC